MAGCFLWDSLYTISLNDWSMTNDSIKKLVWSRLVAK